ncbi:MAG TPA: 4Fe-4S dicluster domain-containing protein [Thermoanaerobacterales bacterium]|nr:4Fe-4S dicluster domain-containing protein [Thermoanaerobacterales bacterium]
MSRVYFHKDKCIHCGVCTAVCPSNSLVQDKQDWKVSFNESTCLGCESCIDACPRRAISVKTEAVWLYV